MALGGASSGGGAGGVRAGRAYVELGAKDGLSGVLKRVGARFAAFGKMVLAATGVGGIIGGILGGLSFKDTADDLAKMNDVAKAFGITGSRMSGLFGLLATAGGEFKENLEGVIQFSGTLDKAVQGVGQGAELFDGLKLSAKEIADLSIDEQFYRVLGAIREMPQPLQESKLALLGGTDSMKQWQRLLSMSEADAREIAKSMAISTVELEEATAASRALERVGASINRVWQQTVILLAPVVTDLAGKIVEAMKPLVEWMKGRTLGDIWDEVKARWTAGVEFLKATGKAAWEEICDQFVASWNGAVLRVKSLFASLGYYLAKEVQKAMTPVALALAQVNPAAAKALYDAVSDNVGVAVEAGNLAKQKAKEEFDRAEAGREARSQERRDAYAQTVGAIAATLNAELDRINQRVKGRLNDVEPNQRREEKLSRIGATLGTFATPFAKQAFGTQSADLGKKMHEESKKHTKLLGDIKDHLAQAGPLVVTA